MFNGDPSKTASFITHVKLYIYANGRHFEDDIAKICLLCSFLTNHAFEWASPYLENLGSDDLPDCMTSFNLFLEEFRNNFGEINEQLHNESTLLRLRQGKASAAEYAASFRRLSASIGYNDTALLGLFREGLSDELKDELVTRDLPTDLSSYIIKIVELDNRIRDRGKSKRHPAFRFNQAAPRFIPPVHAPNNNSDVQPMDLDATRARRFVPLSAAEKVRRRTLGLCLYCGNEGHIASVCPNKKGKASTQGF